MQKHDGIMKLVWSLPAHSASCALFTHIKSLCDKQTFQLGQRLSSLSLLRSLFCISSGRFAFGRKECSR